MDNTREYLTEGRDAWDLLDGVDFAIAVLHPATGAAFYVNRRLCDLFGCTREQAYGLDFGSFGSGAAPYAPDDAQRWLRRVFEEGPQVFDWHAKANDGHLFWVQASMRLARFRGDDRVLVTMRDISHEHELAESTRREIQAKSGFLANMSHEIRTPLTALIGFSQLLLREDGLLPRHREQVATINRSAEHLLAIINDILEISRLDAGRVVLHPSPFDLEALIQDLAAMFRGRAEAKRVSLRLAVDDGVPRAVIADQNKLRQILVNLLGNAVRFTERGGVVCHVGIDRDADGALRLLVNVEDTGVGISPSDMGRLFLPFEQAAAGAKAGGTGLGLAISRQLARMMGGDITVESELGTGSRFRANVRIETAEPEAIIRTGPPRPVAGIKPGSARTRILVVDDQAESRLLMVETLNSVGFQTREAVDGRTAVATFESWLPDAILMDMRMPGMSGHEATRRIKATAEGRKTPIIAITAAALDENRQRALAAGVDDFIAKPFSVEELLEKLRICLDLEYVYSEPPSPDEPLLVSDAIGNSIRNALSIVPRGFTARLREATINADYNRIIELVDEIAGRDAQAGEALRKIARRFDYEQLLSMLENANSDE